ncbi:hypothetical protein [Tannerella sp.]|uniref:hypothetical protein n=1 Tax=Tannerella sp. TaxID=2382127 RepID=UPI0026DC58BF|nr:hypothetical protein [Tannerella sp.]MDO4704041.1 hypothetical protein [Tannerella sp.]
MKRFLKRLYRYLFCRKGYGVHSPFVFDLITNVLEERYGYYAYTELKAARLMLQDAAKMKDMRISQRECEWLFRLANRFKPSRIIMVGSGAGLIPLCLTSYVSGGIHGIALEQDALIADVTRTLLRERATSPVEVRCEAYETSLPKALSDLGRHPDCIVLDGTTTRALSALLRCCADFIHEDTLLIVRGIDVSPEANEAWRTACAFPSATVSIDACTWGIIFFRPGLPRKTFRHVVC